MSLINNMLRDLENRNQQEKSVHLVYPVETRKTRVRANYQSKRDITNILTFYRKIGLLAATLVLLLLIAGIFMGSKKSIVPKASLFLPNNSVKTPDLNKASEVLDSIQIKNISISVKDNLTELTFMLNKSGLYRLKTNKDEIVIIFDNADLLTSLPQFDELRSGVSEIKTVKINNELYVTIKLTKESEFLSLVFDENKAQPDLTLSIENKTPLPPQADIATAQQNIKTIAMETLVKTRYQQALELARLGKYKKAMQQLMTLIKIKPDMHDARVALSALLLDQGETNYAEGMVDSGLEISPDNTDLIELKARILTMKGKLTGALDLLQQMKPRIEDNPDYHAFIAALYERTNNNALAVKIYRELLRLNTHNGNWWLGLGMSLEKLHQSNDAMKAYENALLEGNLNSESIAYLRKRLRILEEVNHAPE